MKIHSNELLRAVRACQKIQPKSADAPEYGMVRIRSGWGIDCCEAFDGSTLVRYRINIDHDDEERLDSAFEYKALVAWLEYVDGEIEIVFNGKTTFECNGSELEKPFMDASSFPVKQPPDNVSPFVVLESKQWEYLVLHTDQDPESSMHGATDCGAMYVVPLEDFTYGFTSDGIWSGTVELVSDFCGTEPKPFAVPGQCISKAFKATGAERIQIERLDGEFFVASGMTEVFMPFSAGENLLDRHCAWALGFDAPFITVPVHEIHAAVSAIMNGSISDRPRMLFYTLDGMLHVAGGEHLDFHSMPIRPFPVEIPEDFSKIMADARMFDAVMKKIPDGHLWFLSNPAEGITQFKIVGEHQQSLIQPMKRRTP